MNGTIKDYINVADLINPNDKQGRSYREINMADTHLFDTGELVEVYGGCRLFVVRHTRDCDGTPLYTLGYFSYDIAIPLINGVCGEDMALAKERGEL